MGFPGGSVVKNRPATAGDMDSIPGSRRFPGREGNGNALQHSCLGNPMNRGAWRVTVHGAAKGWTQLNMHSCLLGHLLNCSELQFSPLQNKDTNTSLNCREGILRCKPLVHNSEWVKVIQSCLSLCDPMNCSPPDSSVHGILQARILGEVAMPSSRGSS